jgi:nucleoside-diphosphate-sugar epimerase
MSTVLVTGGLGGSGRWIVDRLAAAWDEVVCVDRVRGESGHRNVDVRQADLTDRGEVYDLVTAFDPDAVVHWGAIPDPEGHAGGTVFENNVVSTYNVLEAAGRVGADVVWASSESAYGFPFAEETPLPDYLPVDEDHPVRPEDPYGTSKVVGEAVAEMVVRRYDVSVVSIRPSWIQYPGEYECKGFDPSNGGVGNFWSYIDIRDIASVVSAALAADIDGHEPLLVAADENYGGEPTVELVEERFGEVPDDVSLAGEESAMSNARAKELLEWAPEHTWREARDEDVEEPDVRAL